MAILGDIINYYQIVNKADGLFMISSFYYDNPVHPVENGSSSEVGERSYTIWSLSAHESKFKKIPARWEGGLQFLPKGGLFLV
ncbi:MAG: hypothetical protein KAV87_20540 [Desulfobacteraceae bacterium]|nr:hypothetical protein [Desulfobacteraceae bacterium]